jgi:hypothetical protein
MVAKVKGLDARDGNSANGEASGLSRVSPMTVIAVLALLDAERDEWGMRNWEKLGGCRLVERR